MFIFYYYNITKFGYKNGENVKTMKCDNKICIYYNNGQCQNIDIEIDWRGICKTMIPIRITMESLSTSKLYSKVILESKDYISDKETGEYVCIMGASNYDAEK